MAAAAQRRPGIGSRGAHASGGGPHPRGRHCDSRGIPFLSFPPIHAAGGAPSCAAGINRHESLLRRATSRRESVSNEIETEAEPPALWGGR